MNVKETPLERLKRLQAEKSNNKATSPIERLRLAEQQRNAPVVPDCLAEVEYTGNAEKDSELELSATLKAFIERRESENKRRQDATDSEFWFCACFQTREQKEEFLTKIGLIADGDKYIDGRRLAEVTGIELSPTDVSYRDARIDPKYAALAMPLPSE